MRRILAAAVAVAVAVPAGLVLGPYLAQSELDEALPENLAAPAAPGPEGMPAPLPDDPPMDEAMPAAAPAAGAPVPVLYSGEFVGVGDGIHDARGRTLVIPLDDGTQVLRLEDFWSTNGPGLYVYLSADRDATDFVSLGRLKANQGNQNYAIPPGTDLSRHGLVLVWCEPFGVLFGSSELAPA